MNLFRCTPKASDRPGPRAGIAGAPQRQRNENFAGHGRALAHIPAQGHAAMTAPSYRFNFEIVDEATGNVVISDFCGLTAIDQFGGCESVDMHVASMLRAFTGK